MLSAQRLPQLDGLRGLAILLVAVWHYAAVPLLAWAPESRLLSPLRFAWSGVDLFFVLSGFLIGGILLDERDSASYFRTFYTRRACRILPLYFLWLGLFFALALPWGARLAATPLRDLFVPAMPWWSYATLTQNFAMASARTFGAEWLGITWSLAIEEQFYLFLPFLVRWLPRRVLPWTLGFLAAAAPLLRWLLDPSGQHLAVLLPFCRADALMSGALCAWLVRREAARRWLLVRRRWLYALLLLQLAVLLALGASRTVVAASPGASFFSRLALLYATLLLLAVIEERGPLRSVLGLRSLRGLGTIAYCLYLCHQAVNALVHAWWLGEPPGGVSAASFAASMVAFLLACAVGAASWRWFEGPLVRLGQRARYAPPSGSPSPPPAASPSLATGAGPA